MSNTTTCPDCDGMVSKAAHTCPHCGHPFKEQEVETELAKIYPGLVYGLLKLERGVLRVGAWVIVIILIIVVLSQVSKWVK